MKLICTTDFSRASVNAVEFAFNMLKHIGGGEMEIIHCIHTLRRSDIFLSIDDILEEKALDDMKALGRKYTDPTDNIRVTTSVFKAYAKTFLPQYAKQKKFDLIVTGTIGLTSLKDMTVGSLTDHIAKHADVPLLTIPPDSKFKKLENIVVGIGQEELKTIEHLKFLREFIEPYDAKVHLVQVLKKEGHKISVDLRIEENLHDLDYEYTTIQRNDSVNHELNNYSRNVEAELLCLLHQKRNWAQNLLHRSITKEELFVMDRPILIVPT